MTTLILADYENDTLKAATLSAITAAAQLGAPITVLVAGSGVQGVAKHAASIAGVSQVLCADAAEYAHGLAENIAPLLVQLAAQYPIILAAATSTGKNILPRVAAMLDVAMVSEITQIIDKHTFVRPMYAGNINATIQSHERLQILSIRPTAFVTATSSSQTAPIQAIAGTGEAGLSRWISTEIEQSARPKLATARVVLSGGRALGSAERFQSLLVPLADKLHAALGATRAAVDAGYAPNEWQVGQTGTVVAPELYIAVGVAGAAQHIAGIKDSRVIVAINHDPDAPIFQWADYGLVADLFDAVTELQAAV